MSEVSKICLGGGGGEPYLYTTTLVVVAVDRAVLFCFVFRISKPSFSTVFLEINECDCPILQ